MRAMFGVVSLLIVLAVVGWTARAALHRGGTALPTVPAAMPAPLARPQQVQRDVDAVLRQGRARNDDAERQDVEPADPSGRAAAAAAASGP